MHFSEIIIKQLTITLKSFKLHDIVSQFSFQIEAPANNCLNHIVINYTKIQCTFVLVGTVLNRSYSKSSGPLQDDIDVELQLVSVVLTCWPILLYFFSGTASY